jgi:HEPN domain-containing protein
MAMNNLIIEQEACGNPTDNSGAVFPDPLLSWRDSKCVEERLRRIKESLPEKVLPIYPLIQLLVTAIAPSRIYMLQYGSGQDAPSASTELLVVGGGRTDKPFAEMGTVLEMANLGGWDVDCSLYNEGSVIEGLRNGHIFYSLYFTEDGVVYDSGSPTYPVTSLENLNLAKQRARERFREQYEKSQDFLQCAISLNKSHPSAVTMFLIHQAAELIYRGILLSLNGYDRKTHEIRALIRHSGKVGRSLRSVFNLGNPDDIRLLKILDTAYLSARYDDNYQVDLNDLPALFNRICLLQQNAQHFVNEVTTPKPAKFT